MDLPCWVDGYIGIPFVLGGRERTGLDCWGLVRLVLREQFQVDVPSGNATDHAELAPNDRWRELSAELLAERDAASANWLNVARGAERAGDVLLIRMRGYPLHVAIVIAPSWMLHIEEGIDSVVEDYRSRRWCQRITEIYRHAKLSN